MVSADSLVCLCRYGGFLSSGHSFPKLVQIHDRREWHYGPKELLREVAVGDDGKRPVPPFLQLESDRRIRLIEPCHISPDVPRKQRKVRRRRGILRAVKARKVDARGRQLAKEGRAFMPVPIQRRRVESQRVQCDDEDVWCFGVYGGGRWRW